MEKEKRLVTLSMVILFFSLVVVYSLFYQVKGQTLKNLFQSAIKSWEQKQDVDTGSIQLIDEDLLATAESGSWILEWENISDTATWNDALQVATKWEKIASTSSLTSEGESPKILSGTDLYFGAVESIELLGLEPEYLLKDTKGFYYAKLEKEPDLKKTVQDLNGSIYTITSEAELLKNQLFGDKVSFVNLPEYKNKMVIMLLSFDGQYWFIQMEYAKYHQSKKYLKTLFTQ